MDICDLLEQAVTRQRRLQFSDGGVFDVSRNSPRVKVAVRVVRSAPGTSEHHVVAPVLLGRSVCCCIKHEGIHLDANFRKIAADVILDRSGLGIVLFDGEIDGDFLALASGRMIRCTGTTKKQRCDQSEEKRFGVHEPRYSG